MSEARLIAPPLILAILLASQVGIYAQIKGDTLKGVEVVSPLQTTIDPKAGFKPGTRIVGIDSNTQQAYHLQSIATLLSQVSSVFIRNHGFNSLATLSFRGASSAQSAVYWEGVPLINAATGVTDISLLPVAFSDSISLQYGSSAALLGSGNVGGALLLTGRQPQFQAKTRWSGGLQLGWGSFGNFPASAEIGVSSRRLSLRLRGVRINARNDYPAADESGVGFNTENAAIRGEGLLLDASHKVGKRDIISVHAWQQSYTREIPRALFETGSRKLQDDGALRFLVDWQHHGKQIRTYVKAARMQEWYSYRDPVVNVYSEANTYHYFAEVGAHGKINASSRWLVFMPVQLMKLDGLRDSARQFRAAVAGSLDRRLFKDRLTVAANGRLELFDEKLIGLPGLSGSFRLTSRLSLRASLQRSYRAPTLNELYYFPGGNRNLRPEHGWSEELGYDLTGKPDARIIFSHSLTTYNRNIKDWIIWLGGAIWTPHNLAAVHSRGLETDNRISGVAGAFKWRAGLTAAFTRSTPTASELVNDNSIGKQIPYTPMFTASALAQLNWKGLGLSYVQSYAGKRYITSDESASIPSFTTGNLLLNLTTGSPRMTFTVNASVQNIWNAEYQVVAMRPMPGIHYLGSVLISCK